MACCAPAAPERVVGNLPQTPAEGSTSGSGRTTAVAGRATIEPYPQVFGLGLVRGHLRERRLRSDRHLSMAMPWRSFVANTTSSGHRSLAAIADPGLGQI